ncbi:MAG: GNAT family N-acetyltransferase [Acidobacteriota bacterium]
MPAVTLSTFDPERDLPRVVAWVRRPHVVRWWGDPEQSLTTLRGHPAAAAALIHVDGRPVGFLCWQTPPEEELHAAGLGDLPRDLVDVDIMIGEPDTLGQGVGPAALGHLLARFRAEGVRAAGLATAVANERALRAFEKAGFRPYRDFREGGCEFRYLIQTLSPTA